MPRLAIALPTALALLCAARPAAALRLGLVASGRIERVVAAGTGVAVLRDGEVTLLDAQGRVVGRCAGATATAGRARRADGTARSREEVLGEAGLSDEDQSPEAEELLEDEGLEPPARAHAVEATSGMPRALDVAGTAEAAWIGTADGLWRLDARGPGCARAGIGGHAIERVAAARRTVVAIADFTVWRSRDLGASFDVAAVLTSRARALALAEDGETAFVADEDGVVEVRGARGFRRVLERRADALASCGPGVVALAEDGVYRLGGESDASRAGARPPVRALACASPDGPGLLAAGVGLWSSADGATWLEEASGTGRSFSGVAFAAGQSWVVGDEGLFAGVPEDAERPPSSDRPPAALGGRGMRAPPLWAALLPRIAVAFDEWTESTGRGGWRVRVLLSVTFDRHERQRAARSPEDLR